MASPLGDRAPGLLVDTAAPVVSPARHLDAFRFPAATPPRGTPSDGGLSAQSSRSSRSALSCLSALSGASAGSRTCPALLLDQQAGTPPAGPVPSTLPPLSALGPSAARGRPAHLAPEPLSLTGCMGVAVGTPALTPGALARFHTPLSRPFFTPASEPPAPPHNRAGDTTASNPPPGRSLLGALTAAATPGARSRSPSSDGLVAGRSGGSRSSSPGASSAAGAMEALARGERAALRRRYRKRAPRGSQGPTTGEQRESTRYSLTVRERREGPLCSIADQRLQRVLCGSPEEAATTGDRLSATCLDAAFREPTDDPLGKRRKRRRSDPSPAPPRPSGGRPSLIAQAAQAARSSGGPREFCSQRRDAASSDESTPGRAADAALRRSACSFRAVQPLRRSAQLDAGLAWHTTGCLGALTPGPASPLADTLLSRESSDALFGGRSVDEALDLVLSL